ncbi:MAG: phosphatidylserine/phosphatidylglycerophosphate/cardiolipin synthase family protein [Bdellovibrionales bacterium]
MKNVSFGKTQCRIIMSQSLGEGFIFRFQNMLLFFILFSQIAVSEEYYKNKALIVDQPMEALFLRTQLIESAEKEILLMYYQFHADVDGLILLSLLKDAALRGVSIRIIVDYHENKVGDNFFEDLLRSGDVAVQVYNPLRASMILNPYRYTYRMHDKLVLIDRELMLTGGRNVAKPYYGHKDPKRLFDDLNAGDVFEFIYRSVYGFSPEYIFDVFHEFVSDQFNREKVYIDRDVLLSGPVTHLAYEYFLERWNQKITKPIGLGLFGGLSPEREALKKAYYTKYCKDGLCENQFYYEYALLLEEECLESLRATTRDCYKTSRRFRTRLIRTQEKFVEVKSLIENYEEEIQFSDGDKREIENLKGSKLLSLWTEQLEPVESLEFLNKLSTNISQNFPGVKSSDISKTILDEIANVNGDLLLQAPYMIPTQELYSSFRSAIENNPDSRIQIVTNSLFSTDSNWAHAGYERHKAKLLILGVELYEQNTKDLLHSKSMVFGEDVSFIGTYNLDPRSQNLNSEMGVLIRDYKFSESLRKSIELDMLNTYRIGTDGLPEGLRSKYPGVPWFRLLSYYKRRMILSILPIIETQL